MNRLLYFIMSIFLLFISCKEEDGYGVPMKWKSDVTIMGNNMVEIPANGGVYTFICTNHSSFFVLTITEDDTIKQFEPPITYNPLVQHTSPI